MSNVGGERGREGTGQKPPLRVASLGLLCLAGVGTGVSSPQRTAQGTPRAHEERWVCFGEMVAGPSRKRIRPTERSERISESPSVGGTEHSVSEWAGDTASKYFE